MASYLGVVELGTLLKNGVEQPRPTKPWRISSEPYTGAGVGDIADFSTLQDMSKWEIGNTSATPANRLRWHKIQDGEKTLLICDRVILTNVSWNDLNSQGYIFGKNITIDGQQYKCRVLTGGKERREGGEGSSYGGGKLPNEWDHYIGNELNIQGLPIPSSTDLDSTLNDADKDSPHNQFWNWMGVYSWCQETYIHDAACRAVRGYFSARNWLWNYASNRYVGRGWRPVLEILNSAPQISGRDEDLGAKSEPFTLQYQVSDPDGDAITVTEKVNDVIIRTISGAPQNQNITLSIPSEEWITLTLGQHTVQIIADDGKGGVTTRTYTFTKVDDRIEFELKNPIETTAEARRIVVSGRFVVPDGAELTMYACNNGFDEEPAWENITLAFHNKEAHEFVNKSKTAEKWGVNFRVVIAKNTATEELAVEGFGIRFD